jgi:putative transcriptional regulator
MELLVPPGSFLAAGPDLLDPNFRHAVVLIGQHGPGGAYGLVLNRVSPHTTDGVLDDSLALGRAKVPISLGGPVGLDTLQIVHRAPQHVEGGVELCDGLFLGGEFESLGRYVEQDPDAFRRDVRLFLGYAGWGAGQLEAELESGTWLPAPADTAAVFESDPERLWRQVVRRLGESTQGFERQPPDPRWN